MNSLLAEVEKLDLVPLESEELQNIDGGLFPIIILGVVITAEAVAYGAAAVIGAAGAYVGYKNAEKADK